MRAESKIEKKETTRFQTSYKTVLSSKIFPKHDLERSFREQSILGVHIGKFGPLREPIRKLLFSADQFSHIIIVLTVQIDSFYTRKNLDLGLPPKMNAQVVDNCEKHGRLCYAGSQQDSSRAKIKDLYGILFRV